MARQLSLLNTPRSWKLSESTREVGRKGVASARASLEAAVAATRAAEAGRHTPEHPSHRRSAA